MSQPFSFVQITDLHLGDKVPGDWLAEDLRQIESEAGALDFIAATGDLTDRGTDEECRTYAKAITATRLRVYPVVGNHDYVNGTWQAGKMDAGSYQKHISPLNYSFDHKGVHFTSYDSIEKGNEERPSEWLLSDLAAQPPEIPVILLVHYPLKDSFYNALKKFPIMATLSGHWHTSRLYHDGKIAHFNSPPLCFGGIDYSPRSYRIFRWDGSKLHCKTVPLRRPEADRIAATPPSKAVEVLWTAPLDAETHMAAPVLHENQIVMGLMNEQEMQRGGLGCWDAETGRELWRIPLQTSVKSTPALHRNLAIAATVTGEVLAVDILSGQRRWTYQLGDPSARWIFSSPCVHNDRVYAGQGSHFAALDAGSGKPVWVRTDINRNDWISSYVSPGCDGERVYYGFFWSCMGAVDAQTGKTLWKFDDARDVSSTLVPDGRGAVYVMRGEHLQKLDGATGAVIWQHHVTEGWNPNTPLVQEATVYAASGAGKVFALDASSGALKWSWECGEDLSQMRAYQRSAKTILSSPKLAGNCLVVGCNDGRLVGLNAESGVLAWEHDFGVPVSSTPAILGERMFIPSRKGSLVALRRPV